MALNDKINNSAEKGLGAAKEQAGKILNDPHLEQEGRTDQVAAEAKQAGEKIQDAASGLGENIKDAAQKVRDSFSK